MPSCQVFSLLILKMTGLVNAAWLPVHCFVFSWAGFATEVGASSAGTKRVKLERPNSHSLIYSLRYSLIYSGLSTRIFSFAAPCRAACFDRIC
jgi:hypothetical protein